jgi:hypothetical protein
MAIDWKQELPLLALSVIAGAVIIGGVAAAVRSLPAAYIPPKSSDPDHGPPAAPTFNAKCQIIGGSHHVMNC